MKKLSRAQQFVQNLLSSANIELNGKNSWDPQIHNEQFYNRVMTQGSLGLGDSYMDGWWDCESLDELMNKALHVRLEDQLTHNKIDTFFLLFNWLFNLQNRRRAFEVGKKHYDISNTLYQSMLDKNMIYSCGYWENAKNLDQAQLNKLDLICRKLQLKSGMRLLDIGCGWGGLAKFAVENYGVSVVGITISKQQQALAQERCQGLPIEIRLQDYRDLNETFDSIVSVGMFEHVGVKNYVSYMETIHRCLKDSGLFLLHTIGSNRSKISADPWISKHIFPNGMLPSIKQIATASEKLFVIEDWHNFGADYDKTLMAWFDNFNQHWHELKNKFDDRFYRMWKYYLLSCAGAFRARNIQLWQVVLSKHGVAQGYLSIR